MLYSYIASYVAIEMSACMHGRVHKDVASSVITLQQVRIYAYTMYGYKQAKQSMLAICFSWITICTIVYKKWHLTTYTEIAI